MSISMLLLAVVGVMEALAFVARYRASQVRRFWPTYLSTIGVCVLRVAFVTLGAGAVMREEPVWAVMLAYAVPAALVSGWLDRAKAKTSGGAA